MALDERADASTRQEEDRPRDRYIYYPRPSCEPTSSDEVPTSLYVAWLILCAILSFAFSVGRFGWSVGNVLLWILCAPLMVFPTAVCGLVAHGVLNWIYETWWRELDPDAEYEFNLRRQATRALWSAISLGLGIIGLILVAFTIGR
jgi:hypothetical protein